MSYLIVSHIFRMPKLQMQNNVLLGLHMKGKVIKPFLSLHITVLHCLVSELILPSSMFRTTFFFSLHIFYFTEYEDFNTIAPFSPLKNRINSFSKSQ